jgi:hypothetical protein
MRLGGVIDVHSNADACIDRLETIHKRYAWFPADADNRGLGINANSG